MNAFTIFMASKAGRLIRILTGTGLIAWGLVAMAPNPGYIIAAVGVLPLFTGLLNICLIGPIFGGPVSGKKALELSVTD